MAATDLLEQAIDAHGGMDRWRSAREVRVRLSSGGRLFDQRLPKVRRVSGEVRFLMDRPYVEMFGYGEPCSITAPYESRVPAPRYLGRGRSGARRSLGSVEGYGGTSWTGHISAATRCGTTSLPRSCWPARDLCCARGGRCSRAMKLAQPRRDFST